MRLKQIKLAGFKSFVDTTSFEVPSQLVGVVGPNGCGKSNIMDAVRWVLGESRASELRGESMADVIFNGSDQRKPAGRASVELVFDNASGRIGGEWGRYSEIAVRRSVTRDGGSSYFINNQPVRRRDVHDIFLGTGLGPRAYAIIGQGTVSRIIEARPEDLRVFLEEAAGVSRYKERRKETEARLADTRDNLVRVDDILRELDGQLARLEKQAETATRFKTLDEERQRKQHMLWLTRRDEALAEQARLTEEGQVLQAGLDALDAAREAADTEAVALATERDAAADAVHAAQATWYEAGAEVARIEAQLRFAAESRAELDRQIQQAEAAIRQATEARDRAVAVLESARVEEDEAAGAVESLLDAAATAQEALAAQEDTLRDAQRGLDTLRDRVAGHRRELDLAAAAQRAAQEGLRGVEQRHERLSAELRALRAPGDQALAEAAARLAETEEADAGLQAELDAAEDELATLDAARQPAQEGLRAAQATVTHAEARLQALRGLQERSQANRKITPWLDKHGLAGLSRLWQKLRIQPGWETAIEAVLRERVNALAVGRLETAAAFGADAPPARLAFHAPAELASAPVPEGLVPLAERVSTDDPGLRALLHDWLHGHHVANDLPDALSRRTLLPPGGCFVSPAGHVVGRAELRYHAPEGEQDGFLARHQEIETLGNEMPAALAALEHARQAAGGIEQRHAQAAPRLRALRAAREQGLRDLASRRIEVERLRQQAEAARGQRDRIQADIEETAARAEGFQEALAAAEDAFGAADEALALAQQALEDARTAAEQQDAALAAARERLRATERDAQEAAFRQRAAAARIEASSRERDAATVRIDEGHAALEALAARREAQSAEEGMDLLEAATARRARCEGDLQAARAALDALATRCREAEERRLHAEREQAPLRAQLVALALKEQAARLSAEQFAGQLLESGADEAAVRAGFAEPPRASWLQGELTRLGNAIAALGAVNLAALDELAEARERRGFLGAQHADLTEAMGTLEDAIRHIDRETRSLLQATFDAVNTEFGRLFPRLFGGGEAKLVLTGGEILDAGVQVMAQPPGKRNSTIHLLSGGEKALAAIALVFAMFKLNPAPFCLLDEVDAPLDDANTERWCRLIREMSEQTQFLFITHNKVAMELALQLVGVTMQERGVSRIVAVDLEAAGRFAQAA